MVQPLSSAFTKTDKAQQVHKDMVLLAYDPVYGKLTTVKLSQVKKFLEEQGETE